MKAKVLSIYDEGAIENTSLIGAKGLSILVDIDGDRTLFDTGMRGRYLIHNMDFLGIEPDSISRVVLSHNHKSNIGGLGKLLENRTKPLDVYTNSYFSGITRSFGRPLFDEEAASKIVTHEMSQDTDLNDNLYVTGPFGDVNEFFLVIKTRKGPVVISSCYHGGTSQVLAAVKGKTGKDPACLIGGIHLPKVKQKDVDPTAEIFKSYGSPDLYMNHCAGPSGITFLRVHFTLDGVKDFFVGSELEFDL